MRILPEAAYAAMIAAAEAAGATRVRARTSYIRANLVAGTLPPRSIRPGTVPAYLRCSPSPCIRLEVVADAELEADWEIAE